MGGQEVTGAGGSASPSTILLPRRSTEGEELAPRSRFRNEEGEEGEPAEEVRGGEMEDVGVAEMDVAASSATTPTPLSRTPDRTRTLSVVVVEFAVVSICARTSTLLGPGTPPLVEETSEVGVAELRCLAIFATTSTSPADRAAPTAEEAPCVADFVVVQFSTATHDAPTTFPSICIWGGME